MKMFFSAALLGLLLTGTASAQAPSERAAWMIEARWGVMIHYLADWRAEVDGEPASIEQWNRLVNGFDVDALAGQLREIGAGYCLLSIGQNSGYYLAPNPTYDRLTGLTPSKCSTRDLVADLSAALGRHGIRLMVYLPAGAPNDDPAAVAALGFQGSPHRNREFQLKWEQVISDWSERWGGSVAGWWFDGCHWPNVMYRSVDTPNFASFAAAARAGNPQSALAFNAGMADRLLSVTPHEDYSAGLIDLPERMVVNRVVDGRIDAGIPHVLSYLSQTWGRGGPRFENEQVRQWTRTIAQAGGVMTWDVPVQKDGTIAAPFIAQLKTIDHALRSP